MIDADPDEPPATDSVLISGSAPERFERATALIAAGETDQLVVPELPDELERALARAECSDPTVVSSAREDGERALASLGIAISERIEELDGPDLLLSLDHLVADRTVGSLALFRFVHLVTWRTVDAGGTVVCLRGDRIDEVTAGTIAELFAQHRRVGADRTLTGELSS